MASLCEGGNEPSASLKVICKRSATKSQAEKIRNAEIRRIMEVEDGIIEEIGSRRVKWYGRLCRMDETRITKIVYEWKLEGRRRRPQTS
ncbi:hypothetical protein ANN_25748 [Periplaneta americana]|uniref:Uncharacterized protein n=1 Tax=Periplaneta americana TaxID=6978 RepID=A0ABQ8S4C7_PERAM|nr:hypothetical protein ANN_25748 [Periplaneta americana]